MMVANQVRDLPPDIEKLDRRFERWRSSHTGRLPIPEPLWAAAAGLARQHGVFRIAKALHLEYGKLKELAGAVDQATKKRADKAVAALPRTGQDGGRSRAAVLSRKRSRLRPPAFVELIAPSPGTSLECRVELEGRRGKMRIEFKGIATAELVALGRAWWDGEA
jgi:hypothetical protein